MTKKILFPRYLFRKKLALLTINKYLGICENFLEIGSGQGDFSEAISQKIKRGDLIDFSDEAIDRLQNVFKTNNNIQIIKDDFLTYPSDKQYSLIIMFEVLEHLEDDVSALKKISSLLKNDGLWLMSVPAHMSKWGTTDDIAGHYRRYEKKELIKLLELNNFEIIHLYSYGFPMLLLTSWIRNFILTKELKYKTEETSKQTQTKQSGLPLIKGLKIQKIFAWLTKIIFSDKLLNFYILISKPFNKYDLGDGYLCLLRKK